MAPRKEGISLFSWCLMDLWCSVIHANRISCDGRQKSKQLFYPRQYQVEIVLPAQVRLDFMTVPCASREIQKPNFGCHILSLAHMVRFSCFSHLFQQPPFIGDGRLLADIRPELFPGFERKVLVQLYQLFGEADKRHVGHLSFR